MAVPSTFSSRTNTARPLGLWPVTTVRTFIPCLLSSGLFMVTFLDSCDFVFILNSPFVLDVFRQLNRATWRVQLCRCTSNRGHEHGQWSLVRPAGCKASVALFRW